MNVLLVSQCEKRALTETRRILDQFAERRGDRTWQTPITRAGLDTLRKLLRQTARKNTAVACHWIRGTDHSELLWIVGNARRFNAEGAVPTNTTGSDVLRRDDENDWHRAQDIRLLAQLAALLHDIGKASVAFQERLRDQRQERNLYRHEWVSLRLFLAFVGPDDDATWLARLASADQAFSGFEWTAPGRYQRDGVDPGIGRYPLRELAQRAPLAAAIAWLIVTHHRLPLVPPRDDDGKQLWLGMRVRRDVREWLDDPLAQLAHDCNELNPRTNSTDPLPYWQIAGELPVLAPAWRTQARRIAKALLKLGAKHDDWLDNPYVLHLARVALMLADHHYSSLGTGSNGEPVPDRQRFLQADQSLFANTRKDQNGVRRLNQSLLEHLLGVGYGAGQIAHALPGFERHLPRLANHRGLRRRSKDTRFSWQDRAFDAAAGQRDAARARGAFIVNMASTGCGKTLANARILYALSEPQAGLRVSYALGLRTLTLQTGKSYRHDLNLDDDELAVLVGGSANRALFEYYEAQAEASGSASRQALLEEDSHVLYEGHVADHPLLSRALANPDIARLISAPMLVCTVDHLVPATESLRAGRQIAPMLRLMSSDLVLDELDDYELADLPALTRLVHWAGMLGARVLLSSATLPPALVEGMFMAYRAGRRIHRANRGQIHHGPEAPVEVPCVWVDEFGKPQVATCHDEAGFAAGHARFVEQRVARLKTAEPLRIVELLPVKAQAGQHQERTHAEFTTQVRDACLRLHRAHAETDPKTGKRASFGIVRMANIEPILAVARALIETAQPRETRLHLCVYHARFPLVQRSAIEAMLDASFDRREPERVWQLPPIRTALDTHSEPDHLFVVLASPVCEVGRDWDADWAVAEPSSMRALIQLAGRVQRHRRKPPGTPNLLVLDTNLKGMALGNAPGAAFIRPGFEDLHDAAFQLRSHRLTEVLAETEYHHLTAIPRIQPRPEDESQPRESWVDLEHQRIRITMLPGPPASPATSRRRRSGPRARLEAPACWQYPQAALSGVLPQQQPFRDSQRPGVVLAWLPDEGADTVLELHRVEDVRTGRSGEKLYVRASELRSDTPLESASGVSRWGRFDLLALIGAQAEAHGMTLERAAEKFTIVEVPQSSQGWLWHPWLGFGVHR